MGETTAIGGAIRQLGNEEITTTLVTWTVHPWH
jgi:hypothetical protein